MRLSRHARAAVWQAIVSDLSSIWQFSRESGSVVSTATDSKRNRPAARSFHLALPRAAHTFRNRSNTLHPVLCRSRGSEDSARTGSSGGRSFRPQIRPLASLLGSSKVTLWLGEGMESQGFVLIVYSRLHGRAHVFLVALGVGGANLYGIAPATAGAVFYAHGHNQNLNLYAR
jgi:hypothetical protein